MVSLTDKQAVRIITTLDKLMRSAPDNRTFNTLQRLKLTFKKKLR